MIYVFICVVGVSISACYGMGVAELQDYCARVIKINPRYEEFVISVMQDVETNRYTPQEAKSMIDLCLDECKRAHDRGRNDVFKCVIAINVVVSLSYFYLVFYQKIDPSDDEHTHEFHETHELGYKF